MRLWVCVGWGLLGALAMGCEAESPDPTVLTREVVEALPTPEGEAYLRAVVEAHERADGAGDVREAQRVLSEALELERPAFDEAQIVQLDLAARLGESMLEGGQADDAIAVLEPLLATDEVLPLDVATARALVALGDAGAAAGDDALAVGSFARSIRVMSQLRHQLARERIESRQTEEHAR